MARFLDFFSCFGSFEVFCKIGAAGFSLSLYRVLKLLVGVARFCFFATCLAILFNCQCRRGTEMQQQCNNRRSLFFPCIGVARCSSEEKSR